MHLVELQTTGHRPRSVRQFVRDEQTGELGGGKKKGNLGSENKKQCEGVFPFEHLH